MTDIKVLYVDDEAINLQLFELSFRKLFSVVICLSPLEALEKVKNERFNVVISDYKMPVMNGMQLISEIKKLKPEIACMILSGYVENEVVTDKSLLFKFIAKPWQKNDLVEAIVAAAR
jgi:CheY-like chemotaxis protein